MESRKKSILLALAVGDGYVGLQRYTKNNKTYEYATLEVGHSCKQLEYCKWKADLCRSLTGKKCEVKTRIVPEREINGHITPAIEACRFTCTDKYYKEIRNWLYPNGKKKLTSEYLLYLDAEGLAIWYMDDGSTYVRPDESAFNCEIHTHIPREDAEDLINMFQEKWNIKFNLHHVNNNKYNLRTCSHEGAKFIELIKPFVPDCMSYKLNIPERFIHECATSDFNDSDDDIF